MAGYTGTGGIRGALAATADRVMAELDETARRLALLLRLVHVGEGTDDTRRRVPRDQLLGELPSAAEVSAVLDAFAADDARLITMDGEGVEITHEALLHAWPTLRSWIEVDRAGLLVEQHLVQSAQAWQRDRRDPGGLYRGGRLTLAREWAAEPGRREGLGPLAVAFLDASVELDLAEHQAARTRTRRRTALSAVLAVLLAVALTASVRLAAANQETRKQLALAVSQSALTKSDLLADSDPVLSRFGASLATFFRTSGRPENANRVRRLFELGLQQPDGAELDLGKQVADVSGASTGA
ncbi:hypothetical protein ABH927_003165 [Planotetraspora sp. GP83]